MDAKPPAAPAARPGREDSGWAGLRERLRRFVQPGDDERVLDAPTGTGALAFALAPYVREVVGVESSPELLEEARRRAADFANVTLVEGDPTHLAFASGSFDLAACAHELHRLRRPELTMAELARVTRLGGHVLVIDQVAPADPLVTIELDRYERAHDPRHARTLPDIDVRALLEANGLVLLRAEFVEQHHDPSRPLNLADHADRARSPAPGTPRVNVGWYLAAKPLPRP